MYANDSSAPIRVLLVEDNEEDYHLVRHLLGRNTLCRYHITWASSYDDGLAVLKRGEHEVALFDYRLGHGTGLDLLHAAANAGVEMPIILLTGDDSPEVDREASSAGAADYLSKSGLTTTLLERSIRYALKHAAMLAEVRKSQRQLELFMRSVPCAVCIRAPNGEFLFQNELFKKEFNHSALNHAWDSSSGLNPWPFVDGDRHWLVSSFPMVDAAGQRLEGLAAIDVTARIRAERMLERSMLFLNGLLSSLPVVVTTVDEAGRVLESFGHGLADLDLKDGDLMGVPVSARSPEATEEIKKAIAGQDVNFVSSIQQNGRTHHFENYFRFNEARGMGAIGFSINITRRIQAEAERNRQSQLLRAVYKNLPVVAGHLDAEGRVVDAEGDGLSPRGIHPEELVGQAFAEVFPAGRDAMAQALNGGTASFTVAGYDENDEEWQADFAIFFDGDQGAGAVFFGRDMTERRKLERKLLETSDAERQRIGADLHDGLGQHLTGIACMLTALRDRLTKTRPTEAKSAEDIARLVNEAIAQSRALARGLCPVQLLEQNGLPAALEDLTYQAQLLHSTDCRFETDGASPNCSPEVTLHVYRIAQEAINNAVRHGGAQRIKVSLLSDPSAHRLVIEDNGKGFAPDQRRKEPSSGLRLMNYRSTIIGGEFKLTSSLGSGTRIECIFPNENSN